MRLYSTILIPNSIKYNHYLSNCCSITSRTATSLFFLISSSPGFRANWLMLWVSCATWPRRNEISSPSGSWPRGAYPPRPSTRPALPSRLPGFRGFDRARPGAYRPWPKCFGSFICRILRITVYTYHIIKLSRPARLIAVHSGQS